MKKHEIISEDDSGTCSSAIAAAPAQNLFQQPQRRTKKKKEDVKEGWDYNLEPPDEIECPRCGSYQNVTRKPTPCRNCGYGGEDFDEPTDDYDDYDDYSADQAEADWQAGRDRIASESAGQTDGVTLGATVQHTAGGVGKVVKIVDDQQAIVKDEHGQTYKVMISNLSPVVSEAHGLNKRVKIVAGPAKGKTGTVGEVRHGMYKGAPKEFTIDLDDGGNVRCSAKQLRLIKPMAEAIRFKPGSYPDVDHMPGAVRNDLSNIRNSDGAGRDMPVADTDPDWEREQAELRNKKIGEDRANPKKPRKGTVAWERQRRDREDYLKGFANDPHGNKTPADEKVAGPSGTSTLKKTNESKLMESHFIGRYTKDGEPYVLWQKGHYQYTLTSGVQDPGKGFLRVATFEKGLEDVEAELAQRGFEKSLNEGFPYDVDHMPGKTVKHTNTNCTTCHGRKVLYKTPDGKEYADNRKGSTKIKCHACNGAGYKNSVTEGKVKELSQDLKDKNCSAADFKKKYGKTKAEVRKEMKKQVAESQLNELSNDTLTSYKTKAAADASAADKRGDFERGNKRFSGIVKATNKQFANDKKAREMKQKEITEGQGDGEILVKLSKVINSVQTPEQLDSAKKFANLVFHKLADKIKKNQGFAGVHDTVDLLKQIKNDLKAKAREVGGGVGPNDIGRDGGITQTQKFAGVEEAIDNGPKGRVKTDNIKYGQTRNMTGGTASKEELARRREQQRAENELTRQAKKAKDEYYYGSKSKSAAPKASPELLNKIWYKVEDVVGSTVPDGDPIDYIGPWCEKNGIPYEYVTKAARVHGYRDMYDYYNEMVEHYNELTQDYGNGTV